MCTQPRKKIELRANILAVWCYLLPCEFRGRVGWPSYTLCMHWVCVTTEVPQAQEVPFFIIAARKSAQTLPQREIYPQRDILCLLHCSTNKSLFTAEENTVFPGCSLYKHDLTDSLEQNVVSASLNMCRNARMVSQQLQGVLSRFLVTISLVMMIFALPKRCYVTVHIILQPCEGIVK